MLQLQNVIKNYETKAGVVKAIDGISLTFPDTGMVFITGKSGCGKTTLLNVIGGLDGIDGGEILIQDKKFSAFSPAEYDSYRNTFIGFIFQEYNLLPEFTVEKNIKMAMELQGVQADETAFENLLEEVEIQTLKTRKPSELSGGQRQRVAIARALVKNPRIIMADEPTGALDSGTGIQVFDTLKKLSKDRLVIVVSHDREFAEKYADRLIHLVDGKVEQDVSFTEKEIEENVQEQANALIVRDGAELSEGEKNLLAKAIKERKPISVLENLRYREKAPTGEVKRNTGEPIQLKKSKMKLKSSAFLGLKSLAVKPVRLAFTILISALAFAVFGLFDTVANFNTKTVLQNSLRKNSLQAITATAKYNVDYENEDFYEISVSDKALEVLSEKTEGAVKGVTKEYFVGELQSSTVTRGKSYYTTYTNGFVEFDGKTEIDENGNFKDFNYKIVAGRYPQAVYNDNELVNGALSEIAISTYFADSIMHYLNGKPLSGKEINVREDLLAATIAVNGLPYTIVGLIDCGAIPEKYDALKEDSTYNPNTASLKDDFATYINAGAHKCLFVAKGFVNETHNKAVSFTAGNTDFSFTLKGSTERKKAANYVYDVNNYGAENILLFNGEYPQNGKITLANDEVLIHCLNLENLLAANIQALPEKLGNKQQTKAKDLILLMQSGTMEESREALADLFTLLNNPISDGYLTANVTQKYTMSGESIDKTVKIVGVYFGLDTDRTRSNYKFMMNDELMREFNIYPMQGNYTKILFSNQSISEGLDAIVEYVLSKDGLTLTLYHNAALRLIQENEAVVKQVANLFLYVAIALALLAVFLLYNYISTSIANKKQSVGILRGLGAGGKDILLMFLSESLIISLINAVFAVGFTILGCALVNWYVTDIMCIAIQFAIFGFRQVLLISLISLLTALVSSALPIIHIVKKNPVELIRRS